MRSALADTGAELSALAEHFGYVTETEGRGWMSLHDVLAGDVVDHVAAELLAGEGRTDVAGSCLGSRLAGPLVTTTVAALAHARRCPDPHPAGVALHQHEDGWFDRVAFTSGRLAVLADDPAACSPGTVVVPDPSALGSWWARRTTSAVAPLLDAARARLATGRRGQWGALADARHGHLAQRLEHPEEDD